MQYDFQCNILQFLIYVSIIFALLLQSLCVLFDKNALNVFIEYTYFKIYRVHVFLQWTLLLEIILEIFLFFIILLYICEIVNKYIVEFINYTYMVDIFHCRYYQLYRQKIHPIPKYRM